MSRNTVICAQALCGLQFFSRLGLSQREEIARMCQGRRYDPYELVVSQHEPSRNVFFIINGQARITHFSRAGKETTFLLQNAGECFGELAALDRGTHIADVVAVSELFVAILTETQLRTLIRTHIELADQVMADLVRVIRCLSDRVVEFSTLSVNQRVRAELVRIVDIVDRDKNQITVPNPPTHAELAARVSTHREAVTREISYLKRIGLLRCKRKVWEIKDVSALRQLIGNYCAHEGADAVSTAYAMCSANG